MTEKLTDTDIQRLRDVVRILGLEHQEYDVLSALITILEGRLWDVSHAERQEIDHAMQWAVHDAADYQESMTSEDDTPPRPEAVDASITLKAILAQGKQQFCRK